MKNVVSVLFFALAFTACQKQEGASAETDSFDLSAAATTEAAKEGHGKVQLQYGGKTLVVEGRCGGGTESGDMIVAVQDKDIPAKVFTITFNTKDYPQDGKIYHVRKSDFMAEGKKPVDEVYCGFSEITQKNQYNWSSDAASGTLQFSVNGNEIKCKFDNIKLQPNAMYNKGEYDNAGTASGEMTFYKN